MTQEFNAAAKAMVTRDVYGTVRDVQHVDEVFISGASSPLLAAHEYLLRHGALLGVSAAELAHFSLAPETEPRALGVELRYGEEKPQFDMTTVVFEQTLFGLPIWQAGVSVHLQRDPFVVVAAQSKRHTQVDADMPSADALKSAARLDKKRLTKELGIDHDKACDASSFKVLRQRLMVYRYDPAERLAREHHAPAPTAAQTAQPSPQPSPQTGHLHPTLPLPPVNERVRDGRHRVVIELTFSVTWNGIADLAWVALLDVDTLSVLYLRAFIDDVNGLVFEADPVTLNGGPLPSATTAQLNPLRSTVQLPELVPAAGIVSLTGPHVAVQDLEALAVAPPTRPAGSPFSYDARTDNFAAVNAYYHCDRFFHLVRDLGFDLPTYFTGTPFPSPVDHRGTTIFTGPNTINAYCAGNGSYGILRTAFMLADLGDVANPIGLACDWRVVLHELGGHGILYNHVNSPNFGFAHSAGDSFAAVLNDPGSRAPDRFETFPWVYSVIAATTAT